MQVVYSPVHLAHDITHETYMGVAVPGQRGRRARRTDPDRARGRRRLRADRSDRARRGADHRGPRPGPASGSSRSPGPRSAARASRAPSCPPTRIRTASMFEGMSDEAVAALVREPGHVGGRAGLLGPGLRGAPGRRDLRRVACGRGRRAHDRGPRAGRRAGRLRPVPAARPPRGAVHVRRLLLLQQRGDRGPCDHPGDRRAGLDHRCRLPPRQRQPADLLAPRRRALHLDPRRSRAPVPVLPGPGRRDRRRRRGRARTSTSRSGPGATNEDYLAATDRAVEAILAAPGSVVVVSLGFDTYGLDPIGDFALTTDVYHEVGPSGRRDRAVGWSSSRRAAITGRRSARTPGPGCAAPRAGRSSRCRPPGSRRAVRSSGDPARRRHPAAGTGRASARRSATSSRPRSPTSTVADLVDALQADEAGRLGASHRRRRRGTGSSGTSSSRARGWMRRRGCSRCSCSSPLAVAPDRQGEGIGGDLVRAAIDAADEPRRRRSCSSRARRATTRASGSSPGGPLGFIRPSVRIPEAAFQVIAAAGMGAVDDRAARAIRRVFWRLRRGRAG